MRRAVVRRRLIRGAMTAGAAIAIAFFLEPIFPLGSWKWLIIAALCLFVGFADAWLPGVRSLLSLPAPILTASESQEDLEDGIRQAQARLDAQYASPAESIEETQAPQTTHEQSSLARDFEEIHQIRKMAGRIEEVLGGYGPPLSDEEDNRIREALLRLKDTTGEFAYRKRLKLALRDFVHATGIMLQYKSRHGADGLMHFTSAQEANEVRYTLRVAGIELIAACNEILEPGQAERPSEKLDKGVDKIAVEVEVDPAETIISLIPNVSSEDTTILAANLPIIRVKNNDGAATTIDKIWLSVRRSRHRDDLKPNLVEIEGSRRIEARSQQEFSVRVQQVYEGRIRKKDGWHRVSLNVKALGLGTTSYALAENLFQGGEPNGGGGDE